MKILHTSDWHLGHAIYNVSQEEAQRDMLQQLANIVSEHQPDVFIISGDIYDTTQPSTSVQQMFADAIVKIHDAYKDLTIVCIAGNHDSGSKHMIYHTPWKALNVHMIGSIVKDSDLDEYIIEVPGKGFVVAVPFAVDRYMPDDVFITLYNKVNERNIANLPVVLSAHMAAAKADWRGHESSSDSNIGGLNCQEITIFGKDYDYVALGHIHKQQFLDKDKRIWYSGTPIAISFDEVYKGNEHGVLLVDCPAHKASAKVIPIAVRNIHPLVNLPYEGFAEWEYVKKLFDQYDNDIPSFIRLNVEFDSYLPVGAYDEANGIAEKKECQLCYINSKRKEKETDTSKVQNLTTTELKQIDFMDVAKMYVESQNEVFDDDMKSMLQEVKELLNANND